MRLLFAICIGIFFLACQPARDTTIFTNVRIIDGSGNEAIPGSVRISGTKIMDMGNLEPFKDERVIDGGGLVLCPGFIDSHSHHDRSGKMGNSRFPGIFLKRDVPEVISQGITTIIVGQDGSSHLPISEFWNKVDSIPVAVNIGSYSGHNSIRRQVMGDDYKRPAGSGEVEEMKALLKIDLENGVLGLSTGLEYDPGIYSNAEEVLDLSSLLPEYEGRYISHMRSEDRQLEEAIEELLNIGKTHDIPVQISHFKLARVSLWQKAPEILARLDAARNEGIAVTADIYPYEYWQSTLTVLFPERNFDDIEAARYALSELTTPEGVIISSFSPDSTYVGKTLAEIAALRGETPERVCLDLIKESMDAGSSCGVMARSMHPDDIAQIISWEYSNLCSDGGLDSRHPRGAGSFPRAIKLYSGGQGDLSLEQLIRRMTSNAAQNLGLENRGMIRKGYYADLVLFDPLTMTDKATFENPSALSQGVIGVWVNGQRVWENDRPTQNYPGVAIKRNSL